MAVFISRRMLVRRYIRRLLGLFSSIIAMVSSAGGIAKSIAKVRRVFAQEGWVGAKRRIFLVVIGLNNYTEWFGYHDTLTAADRQRIVAKIGGFQARPLISVLMPVYNPPLEFLEQALQSVRRQLYPHWELCICDDASSDPGVAQMLARHCQEEPRIKVVYSRQNGGISRASNAALALVEGEFIALLDHDDLLAEQALYCVAEVINRQPDVGLIYSDEDKIDADNERSDPYFKCELNYELLLAQNMISHLGVYRSEMVQRLGGFSEAFAGAQDYDLALRALETLQPAQVVHIPRVLYHWRAIPGSTALAASEKQGADDVGRQAVQAHLQRIGASATVMAAPEAPAHNRVRFSCPSPQPLVSIIIPTRDRADLLGKCLDALFERSSYENYEVVIVDNGSVEPASHQLFARLPKSRVTLIEDASPFNYAALNNKAAKIARGDLLCLMNNDIEVLTPDWLEEMVSLLLRPGVGCVGARLWYPDWRLQHGGCVLGVGGTCGHAHRYLPKGKFGYFNRAVLHQSFSAVTGACLLVRRSVFEQVDGLDEQLAVAYNDIDFSLRVREAGYRNVWTPYAEMIHHEFASRGLDDTPVKKARAISEVQFMHNRWGEKLRNDPAYSPNLTLDYEDFSYAWPPRVAPL